MVEVTKRAEKRVDAPLARRLIELELADVEIPPRVDDPPRTPTVFVRVLAPDADRLHVELWDRGEFHGARRVSATGSLQLRARRIALGAAELARRLRHKRLAKARRVAEERAARAAELARLEREKRPDDLAIEGSARVATLGGKDALIAGPGLTLSQRLDDGFRVGLGSSWLAGPYPAAAASPALRWFELELSAARSVRLAPQWDLTLGASAAAASVSVDGTTRVDDISGQTDTWSARAAVSVGADVRLGRGVWLGVAPEVGGVLRPIPVVDAAADRHDLGGLWLGLRVAVALDPSP